MDGQTDDVSPGEGKASEAGNGVGEKDYEQQSLLHPGVKIKATSYVYVYLSHFLSAWGSRMWQFGVGILLVNLTPDSLQLTAIFGLTEGTCVLLFGALVGDCIDNSRRLRAAQITLVGRDFLLLLCATVIYLYLTFEEKIVDVGDWTRYVAYALIIALASGGRLLNVANTITIERDWIVEICASDQEKLATMTATMRGIDLTTQILAPVATGQVMTYAGVANGALFIAGWNLLSLSFEYLFIMKVYHSVPALRKEKDLSKTVRNKAKNKSTTQENDGATISECRLFSGITIIFEGWRTFISYDVMLSGCALAMLYMTVLGFDNVTVGYAKIQGLSESVVGIMMGGAGFVGIMGSVAYPFVRRRIGLPRSGMLALTLQFLTLSACVVAIWLHGSPFELLPGNNDNSTTRCTDVEPKEEASTGDQNCPSPPLTSILVMMSGIIAARFGLWMADLSISQMFMMSVKEQERGVVFGVQDSINKLMDMIKYGLVVALPLIPQFGYLVIISFSFIFGGCMMYLIFLCRLPRDSVVWERKGYQKL